jgi:hypothetical protein
MKAEFFAVLIQLIVGSTQPNLIVAPTAMTLQQCIVEIGRARPLVEAPSVEIRAMGCVTGDTLARLKSSMGVP